MKAIYAIVLSLLLLSACASGSHILTGHKRAPIKSNEVSLYSEPPEKYEVIGIVKASSGSGWSQQGDMDLAVEELKNQAASLGANGVILSETGEIISTSVGTNSSGITYSSSSSSQTVSGKAVYVAK